jgi:hypothetical protein
MLTKVKIEWIDTVLNPYPQRYGMIRQILLRKTTTTFLRRQQQQKRSSGENKIQENEIKLQIARI